MFVLLLTGIAGITVLAGALSSGRAAQPQSAPAPDAEPAAELAPTPAAATPASGTSGSAATRPSTPAGPAPAAAVTAAPPSATIAAARALAAAGTPAEARNPARKEDPFAPPSLVRSQTEQIPWGRALLEFAHPALAIVGIGMWIGFTFIHQLVLGFVAGGVLLVAALAGVSWYQLGKRGNALAVNRRVLAAHAGGAMLALVLALVVVTVARP